MHLGEFIDFALSYTRLQGIYMMFHVERYCDYQPCIRLLNSFIPMRPIRRYNVLHRHSPYG
jgi:hypothetical protein